MNAREVMPAGPVHARISVPGSKSITNRALICAALANGQSIIQNASDSDDTALMANGLNQLGVLARESGDALVVQGKGGRLYAPKFPIPVGNAGTTFRFLLSLAALAEGTTVFEGAVRMAERPIEDLLAALRQAGVEVEKHSVAPRWEIRGGTLKGDTVAVRGDKSSQFLSSLLLVAPALKHALRIVVEGSMSSTSYVSMTLDVMAHFGVRGIEVRPEGYIVPAGAAYAPAAFAVEADASSASYPMAAAAITGGEVFVEGVKKDSVQGDSRFVEILEAMGCRVMWPGGGVTIRGPETLEGVDVDMNTMPDVVPTLAAVALFAHGRTSIRNVAHLRYKESDRLQALVTELGKLGAAVTLRPDGLDILPSPLHRAQLATYGDHRLVMSFALAGLRVPGVRVEEPDSVKKSYPRFWAEFEKFYRQTPIS
ncbi:3-phosphoshikimate 1-carboxyvinyltransferase [bacterium]|nr:MAG: 3-phosphoshikimate 1-carboxyvinyltransferase [bacterium]